jgi:hypothetical protein
MALICVSTRAASAAVGLTYFPGTSDLFVTMNQRDDLGDPHRATG